MSLYKNILWTVLSRYSAQGVAVIVNLLLARYLGSTGFGEYAFISAVVSIGNAFTTFGTDMVLIRRISSSQDYSDLPAALMVQLLFSAVFIGFVFLISPFLPVRHSLEVYVFALIPLAFFTIFTIALRGARLMTSFALLHFVVSVAQMISVFVLIFIRGGVEQFLFFMLGVHLVGVMVGFVLCSLQIEGFLKISNFSWTRIPTLLRSSLQLALIGTLRLFYEKLVVAMLPSLTSVSITGEFAASMRVADAAKLGHLSAFMVIYPEMVRENSAEPETGSSTQKSIKLLFVAAVFLSLFLYLFSWKIIHLLFGNAYVSSVDSLRILAWMLIPYFVVSYYSLAFVSIGVERPVLVSLIFSLIVLALCVAWWGQLYGLKGAAFAALTAEIVQAGLLWFQWRRRNALSEFSE